MLAPIAAVSLATIAGVHAFAGVRIFYAAFVAFGMGAIFCTSLVDIGLMVASQLTVLYTNRTVILESVKAPPLSREDTDAMQAKMAALQLMPPSGGSGR